MTDLRNTVILGRCTMSARIVSTGSYRPKRIVSNHDLSKVMDTSDEWIQTRTGIVTRHYEDESTLNMALHASLKALEGIELDTIDGIIVGTYTADNLIPSVAGALRYALGFKKEIFAFDVNAACSGYIFALHTSYAYIKAGLAKRLLVVGVDYNTRILDFEDRTTSILFGDGAGATVIEAGEFGIIDSFIRNVSDVNDVLIAPSSSDFNHPYRFKQRRNPYFQMEGREVFKFAVKALRDSVRSLCEANDVSLDEIDYVISHQANLRIIETAAKTLKMPIGKFLVNVDEVGNTSSGSVPLLLDESHRLGVLKPGMKVILVAFGGGLTYGASLIQWT